MLGATSRGLKTWLVGPHEGSMSEFAAYRLTALDIPFDGARFPFSFPKWILKTPISLSPSSRPNTTR